MKINQRHVAYICLVICIVWFIWFTEGERIKYLIIRNSNWTRSCVPRNLVEKSNPSVAIIMSYETDYYGELGKISEDDKRKYAQQHGYDIYVNYDQLDPTRKPSWYKVLMAQKHLPNYDWIFYVDADTIIMEHGTPLTTFIDDRYDIVFTHDHRGINAGVWMMKNTEWSNNFLQTWYVQGQDFLDERGINATNPFGKSGDQDTLELLSSIFLSCSLSNAAASCSLFRFRSSARCFLSSSSFFSSASLFLRSSSLFFFLSSTADEVEESALAKAPVESNCE